MAKIANSQPKIGQDATFAPTLDGHNSAIFYPILTSKLYLILLSFQILLRGLTWAVLRAWTQNHPQVIVGTCPGHHPNP